MSDKFTFKKAGEEDIDFIIETILAAEKMGTDIISYCRIFDINLEELMKKLREMLEEDIEGQDLCLSGYLIVKSGKENAGACCSWIEEAEGMSSAMLKANLLSYYLGAERFVKAQDKISLMDEINIKRTPHALQLESFYVKPEFRGLGISSMLIQQHALNYVNNNITFNKAQIILLSGNDKAYKAYEKAGFKVSLRTNTDNKEIQNIFPSSGKILMEADFITIKNLLNGN